MPREAQTTRLTFLVAIAFFGSGCAGLVYQVAWQRILTLHSGVGTYSVAMIVAVFMAGLGLGNALGGRLSARMSPRSALFGFGLLESGIAVFGASSCALYYDVLYLKTSWLYSPAWRAGLLHFAGLLLPTVLMGMTLPLLVRATVHHVPRAARTVSLLYGVNILGASLGAWLTPWILIPRGGIRGAVHIASSANLAAALVALVIAGRYWDRRLGVAPESRTDLEPTSPGRYPLGLWIGLYGLSGFCALALEIVWFRLLDVGVKSTAFTFGTLLSLYLLGSGLGCWIGVPLSERFKRPLSLFLLFQCLLIAYSGLAVTLLGRLPADLPLVASYYDYWALGMGVTLGGTADQGRVLCLYLWFPLFLFGVPTVLMGLSFAALQKAVHHQVRTSGRTVGLLQTANIAGCVAGSLLVGLATLTWWGSTGTLRALMVLGVVFCGVGWWVGERRTVFASMACVLLGLTVTLPGQERLWRRLHGADSLRVLIDEDATGVAAVIKARYREGWAVYVNGKAHSWIPFIGMHTQLGAVPAIVHPAPREVAIIGLGSGDTAWAAGCRPETLSIAVFEIAGPQPRLLARLDEQEAYPALRSFLRDRRVRIQIADGRNALGHAPNRYDLIEADALWPHVSGSGPLYSVEFFRLCASRLKPGGVMCSWVPTPRVMASFVQVFPYVLKGPEALAIGSMDPLPVDTALWRQRFESPAVRDYLGAATKGIADVLDGLRVPPERKRFQRRDVNQDLFPRDEFMVP